MKYLSLGSIGAHDSWHHCIHREHWTQVSVGGSVKRSLQ